MFAYHQKIISEGVLVLLALTLFLILPKISYAYIFCSAGAGQGTCLSICQSNGYDGMYPGTGNNGQSTGAAGFYCASGDDATITRTSGISEGGTASFDDLDILDKVPASDTENFIYIDAEKSPVVNVVLNDKASLSGPQTVLGGVFDDMFARARDFYRNFFSGRFKEAFSFKQDVDPEDGNGFPNLGLPTDDEIARSSNYYIYEHDCPPRIRVRSTSPLEPNWDYWCRKSKEGKKVDSGVDPQTGATGEYEVLSGVDAVEPSTGPVTEVNLYCEVDSKASADERAAKIEKCVNESNLSVTEKEAVLREVKSSN